MIESFLGSWLMFLAFTTPRHNPPPPTPEERKLLATAEKCWRARRDLTGSIALRFHIANKKVVRVETKINSTGSDKVSRCLENALVGLRWLTPEEGTSSIHWVFDGAEPPRRKL
jgi:hypothetical protein